MRGCERGQGKRKQDVRLIEGVGVGKNNRAIGPEL